MCKQNKFVVTQLGHLVVEIPKRGAPGVDLQCAIINGKLMEITDCWLFKIFTEKLRAGGADIYISNYNCIKISLVKQEIPFGNIFPFSAQYSYIILGY